MNILFHFTSPKNALSIVGSGDFHLSIASGSVEEQFSKEKLFFLSTTRTLSNIFATRTNGGSEVLFVLDANKIRARNKVVPVDFWQNGGEYSEAEERIVSDKPTIPIAGIIKEIHCNTGINEESRIKSNGMFLRSLAIQARKKNIPIYMYGSKKDMLSRRASKRIGLFNEATQTSIVKTVAPVDTRPDFIKDIEKEKEDKQKEDLYPFLILMYHAMRRDFSGIKTFPPKSDVYKYFNMLRNINSGFRTEKTVVAEIGRRITNARQFSGVGSQQLKYAEAFLMLARRAGLTVNQVPAFIAQRIAETL